MSVGVEVVNGGRISSLRMFSLSHGLDPRTGQPSQWSGAHGPSLTTRACGRRVLKPHYPQTVLAVALWSFVAAGSVLVGALIAFRFDVSRRTLGLIMGFGAGTLISAVAFDLVLPSARDAGNIAILFGLVAGSLTFWGGDRILARRSGHEDPVVGQHVSGMPLVLGAALDGVPEAVAIGLTMLGGATVSIAMVVAVFLSNIPEGLAATVGLLKTGMSKGRILGLWSAIVAVCVIASVVAFTLMGNSPPATVALIQSFAAGAILTMLANTLMPEAYAHGGREVGLVTVLGFIFASALAAN